MVPLLILGQIVKLGKTASCSISLSSKADGSDLAFKKESIIVVTNMQSRIETYILRVTAILSGKASTEVCC